MIARITGRLLDVTDESVLIDVAGVGYEVMVPALALADLHARIGHELMLHTIQILEGNPAVGNLVPRLLGFVTTEEREFFRLFTKVKGISHRRAMRAMCMPIAQIAAAIEHGDARPLTGLPEVGKKMAAGIIAELQGKMQAFVLAAPRTAIAPTPLSDAQRVAVEILVQWGDRRADAQRWVTAAVDGDPKLETPDAIVRAAYRVKERAGV